MCVVCTEKAGSLRCSSCKAVRYCGVDCQKRQWEFHKSICHEIKKKRDDLKNTEEPFFKLADEVFDIYKPQFGDICMDLADGRRLHRNEKNADAFKPYTSLVAHIDTRIQFYETLIKCGRDNNSRIAFELAAKNMMDLILLCYKRRSQLYHGWLWNRGLKAKDDLPVIMIAADMDQEAFNFIRHFHFIEYGSHEYFFGDVTVNERDIDEHDVEEKIDLETLYDLMRHDMMDAARLSPVTYNNCTLRSGFPQINLDMVLITLIKYKRMKNLMLEKYKRKAMWTSFLMGTHPNVGKMSEVKKLRGLSPVLDQLKHMVIGDLKNRIKNLSDQVEEFLIALHRDSELLLPGMLDPESIPAPVENDLYLDPLEAMNMNFEQTRASELRTVRNIVDRCRLVFMTQKLKMDIYLEHFLKSERVIPPEDFELQLYNNFPEKE